jgi:hypothetical protein
MAEFSLRRKMKKPQKSLLILGISRRLTSKQFDRILTQSKSAKAARIGRAAFSMRVFTHLEISAFSGNFGSGVAKRSRSFLPL